MNVSRKRVLSGMRPTGGLHLGHLVGALENWAAMQDQYETYYCIVDWHALTTDYADTSKIKEYTLELAVDWLCAGLDPDRSALFIQSHVPEHAELHVLLSMVVPLPWLERVPTYKEQMEQIADKDLHTYGFLGYPVLQTADILMYKAEVVPVGADQQAHVELTREIVRRFNNFYGPVFPEPQAKLTPTPKLPGTDGRKMSKSYNNTISLSDDEPTIREKLRTMMTDPARKRRTDPGNPDICPVFDLHKVFSDDKTRAWAAEGCRTAGIGCIDCKGALADHLVTRMKPFLEKRKELESSPDKIWKILDEGAEKARKVARETMKEVRSAVKLQ
ncbi:MAG: tryptophan--tRNA ligase [Vicinamibacteria bacterium]